VRPPRGRSWNASTINGHAGRGSGILRNELYAGRLIWNRVRMIKDPDTGNRVSRPNRETEWLVTEVSELAIVDRALFHAAKSRKQAYARINSTYQRRPRHLLSGLLRCGSCGAGMSTNGKDKSGRIVSVALPRRNPAPALTQRRSISPRSRALCSRGSEPKCGIPRLSRNT
jgi:hypothetical protein